MSSTSVAATASATIMSLSAALNSTSGTGQQQAGISINTFLASLAGGLGTFGLQLGVFLLINRRFGRIYRPRTFLVPERERTTAPPKGLWQWILPVLKTSNSDFIQKCGLDAYFFLRYLRTLLKIFIPLAVIILPILIPLNAVGGRGSEFTLQHPYNKNNDYTDVTGLDHFAWGNVRPTNNNRYWAHLLLAVGVVIYTCFVFFDELRGYIRLRQAYLTSPQHRLRASATTVLVTAIPLKWCTFEALNGLYDVFPGGIRNIWVNRNFDELNDKVKRRNKLAEALESAETSIIRNAKKVHMKKLKAEVKKTGQKQTKSKLSELLKAANDRGLAMAQTDGVSSGDPHQVRHTIDEAVAESSSEPSREHSQDRKKPFVPIPVLDHGVESLEHGFDTIGKTVFGGLKKVARGVDERVNTTGGLIVDAPEPAAVRREPRNTMVNVAFGLHDTHSRSASPDPNPGDGQHPKVRTPSNDSTMRQSTSQDDLAYPRSESTREQHGLGIDGAPVDPRINRDPTDLDVLKNPVRMGEIEGSHTSKLKFWNRKKLQPYGIPSPTPHGQEEDEFPLSRPSPMTPGCNPQATINGAGSDKDAEGIKISSKTLNLPFLGKATKNEGNPDKKDYPLAYNETLDPDDGKPLWKAYVKEKDRDTMRLPIFGWQWMISLPLVGQKVDTINYCRKEVARLNLEIEEDQKEPERYPLMNSAFIQFNHQVAAHMACQAVSHHTPGQMAPRAVEISPDDVIWDNMSIRWWESYIRAGVAVAIAIGLIIGWAFPVTFTGLLSQVSYLTKYSWLRWLKKAPGWVIAAIQGLLPQALLGGLIALLPVVLRLLAKNQGAYTGMGVELSVQSYYFALLFVQVFLVISISSATTTVITQITHDPQSVPAILAQNLPKASNYFFSYLLLQALSVSAGALVQVMSLFQWFILAPLLDSTARQKWRRQINLPNMQWGTFFPVYTNLAAVGLIYSVISPLILVFNIITFGLFWLVYRYNTIYVTKFRFDTGGLLYPRAINQLFTGLYVMELCLVGLFFLVRDVELKTGNAVGKPCYPQGIIMIIVLVFTIIYQIVLNYAFGPLFRYLPITLEDDAVMRDEEFARAQEKQWKLDDNEREVDNTNDALEDHDHRSAGEDREEAENIEMQAIDTRKERGGSLGNIPHVITNLVPIRASWADRSRNNHPKSPGKNGYVTSPRHRHRPHWKSPDVEAQRSGTNAIGEALFSGINDEIEDLTPDERDKLVQRAFQHEALRARRPVIWIPRDELGVSDDEIYRTRQLSKHIWISNEYTGLDGKGRVVYRKSPPDFSEVDLIEL